MDIYYDYFAAILYFIFNIIIVKLIKKNSFIKLELYLFVVILYIQSLLLSLLFELNIQNLILSSGALMTVLLFKDHKISINNYSFNKLDFSTSIITFIYILYGILLHQSGFNFDDVLTTYLPRVELWTRFESIFVDVKLEEYYSPILIYPIVGQLNLLLINLFNLSPSVNMIFSFFIINSIYKILSEYFSLEGRQKTLFKNILFLSPMVLVLATSGLSDLLYFYFFIASVVYLLKYFELGSSQALILSISSAVISISVRYHGIILLVIIAIFLIIKKSKLSILVDSAIYVLITSSIFLLPNLLWNYVRGGLAFFTSALDSQLNNDIVIQFGDNKLLQLLLFDNTTLLKYFLRIYDSISHTVVNSFFADFPLIILLPSWLENYKMPFNFSFLFNFQIFKQAQDVRTSGTIIFILVTVTVLKYYFQYLQSLMSKKKIEKIYNSVPREIYTILIIIFTFYFTIISLRSFSTANFRYLMPVYLLILPLAIKFMKILTNRKLFSLIITISFVSSLQPLLASEMLWEKPYPEFVLESENISPKIRGWHNDKIEKKFNEVIQEVENINRKFNNHSVIFSMQSKFPIGAIDSDIKYFTTHDQFEEYNTDFFKTFDSKILITDDFDFKYDTENILLIGSLQEINELIIKNRSTNCFSPRLTTDYLSIRADENGFTSEEYEKGIQVYRLDSVGSKNEVYNQLDLQAACENGYQLVEFKKCKIAEYNRENDLYIKNKDEFGFTVKDYQRGVKVYRSDSIEQKVFAKADLIKACEEGYNLEVKEELLPILSNALRPDLEDYEGFILFVGK